MMEIVKDIRIYPDTFARTGQIAVFLVGQLLQSSEVQLVLDGKECMGSK